MTDNSKKDKDLNKMMETKGQIEWTTSKEDVWAKMQPLMQQPKAKHLFIPQVQWYAAAAGISLIFGLLAFLSTYKTTINVPVSQRKTIPLPDESKVTLNAQTTLSYKPYWWFANRTVKLEGEAYFEVKKGEKFEVISENAKTTVLGTTFTIYARENQYLVSCFSGKVQISAVMNNEQKIQISKGQQAYLQNNTLISTTNTVTEKSVNAWIENKFAFENQSIYQVFQEIERQYGIKIDVPEKLNINYSGNFDKLQNPQFVINIVCKPLGLTYKQVNPNEYQIFESP